EALIRRTAQAGAVDLALDFPVAAQLATTRSGIAHASAGSVGTPVVDDPGIGEADGDVIAGRAEFLEVARLADPHERIVRLLAVQRVGLNPLLAERDAIRA